MKYSIKVGKVINGTNVEFIATDITGGEFHFVRDDLIKQINELGGSAPIVETNYQPATNFGGNPISDKQVKHLRGLGYTGNLEGLTITQASELIQQIYNERGIQPGQWHKKS